MRFSAIRGRYLVLLTLTLTLILSIVMSVANARKRETKLLLAQKPKGPVSLKAESVTTAPEVLSNIKQLRVASASIVRQGMPDAALAIDIINDSDSPLMAIEISTGDKDDFSSWFTDGLADPSRPVVQIYAHSLKTFEWSLGSMLKGYPVVINAAAFANGTEYGNADTIKYLHDNRRHVAEKLEAERKKAVQTP